MFCECDVHLSHTEVEQQCKQHEGWGCLDTKQEINGRKLNKTCMAFRLPPAECLPVWIFVCELRCSLVTVAMIPSNRKCLPGYQIPEMIKFVIHIVLILISELGGGRMNLYHLYETKPVFFFRC